MGLPQEPRALDDTNRAYRAYVGWQQNFRSSHLEVEELAGLQMTVLGGTGTPEVPH